MIGQALAPAQIKPDRSRPWIIATLGLGQILAWGSSYYLLAILAKPIMDDTGWPLAWVVGGLSLGLLAAAMVSPRIGHAIERRGGRPVLAASAILLAGGLAGLALAHSLAAYLVAWTIIGLGMGAGLYDPAFATLGRLYGARARSAIAALTLFGGFASTACWPLSAYLTAELGWRGACAAYAALHLVVTLPLYLFMLPDPAEQTADPGHPAAEPAPAPMPPSRNRGLVFTILAASITLSAMVSTVISVHLLTILQGRGLGLTAAVALGTLVGPSQVGARFIEMAIGRYHHPIWTKIASAVLVVAGLVTLGSGIPFVSAALVLYGAGIGLESIARGTLPLTLFGPTGYSVLMGRLALPSLMAQALAPSIGAILLQGYGVDNMLDILLAAAGVNAILAFGLLGIVQSRVARTTGV